MFDYYCPAYISNFIFHDHFLFREYRIRVLNWPVTFIISHPPTIKNVEDETRINLIWSTTMKDNKFNYVIPSYIYNHKSEISCNDYSYMVFHMVIVRILLASWSWIWRKRMSMSHTHHPNFINKLASSSIGLLCHLGPTRTTNQIHRSS